MRPYVLHENMTSIFTWSNTTQERRGWVSFDIKTRETDIEWWKSCSKVWIWNFPHYVTTLTRSTRSTKTKLTKYQKVLRPSKLYRHSFLGISKFCFQGNFKFSEMSSGQNWSVPLRNFPNNQNRNFYAYRASWKLSIKKQSPKKIAKF